MRTVLWGLLAAFLAFVPATTAQIVLGPPAAGNGIRLGLVCDGVTDNAPAIQAALSAQAATGSTLVSPGHVFLACASGTSSAIVAENLWIYGQEIIECTGQTGVLLKAASGSLGAIYNILPLGVGPANGSPNGLMEIDNCTHTSVDGKTAANMDGLDAFQNGAWGPHLVLKEDNFYEMPYDGMQTAQFTCSVTLTGSLQNGSPAITGLTAAMVQALSVGCAVAGTGISGGATITELNSLNTVTMSANATANETAESITTSGTTIWNGAVSGYSDKFYNNGRDGYFCEGPSDQHFVDTWFGVNTVHGIEVSGCTNILLDKPESYSNGYDGLNSYGQNVIIVMGGELNNNGRAGYYKTGGSVGAPYVDTLMAVKFGGNGSVHTGTADVDNEISGGIVNVVAPTMPANTASSYNIQAVAGAYVNVDAPICNTQFNLGCALHGAGTINLGFQWNGPWITGGGVQTFTNSPCTNLTATEIWIPIQIPGQSSTFYFPACY